PSNESRTRSRCCRSPKTIWEVRETVPFSFSLCCTKSERRIVGLLHTVSPGLVGKSSISVCTSIRPHTCNWGWLWRLTNYVPQEGWGKVERKSLCPKRHSGFCWHPGVV